MLHLLAQKTRTPEERAQNYIMLFLKASVAAAIVLTLLLGEWELFFLSILALILMFLPEIIENSVKIRLPIEFDLVLVLFIYAAIFLGGVVDAYDRIWWWDALLHISSGFILGFAGFLLLYVKTLQQKIQAGPLLFGLVIFCFGVAFGAVWEIFEFAVDGFFGTNMQKNGLQDTMWDLIVDSLGALVIAVIGSRFVQNPRQGMIAQWIKRFIEANPRLKRSRHVR